ncbi:MAG: 4-hydroxythreonine-4-phosphate dehydrogenase PdxA [Rhodobacteraceae bacterium]|nr:4-hydroxythreonine-4-phosphate dehydrogenase PdxA [Paracoccaceae bacterium]
MTTHLPVALSCGEPAGIGPEIAQQAWQTLRGDLPFLWLGDPRHLPLDLPWQTVTDPSEGATVAPTAMPVWEVPFDGSPTKGTADPRNAHGVIRAIEEGVSLVQNGAAQAICTAPIHKAALQDGAGFAFPGHTEFLAHLAGVDDVVMMLACADLRVVPATIHIALKEVPEAFTEEVLRAQVAITDQALRDNFAIAAPRIAVAGLNPHAGEDGKMGDEELKWMRAAITRLQGEGYDIKGPLPADTMFHARAREGYDVAICAYHDQALIPIKTLDFDGGVNVTLGLPFRRTSPDHGTAFDIAGKGIARPDSLIAALKMAAA